MKKTTTTQLRKMIAKAVMLMAMTIVITMVKPMFARAAGMGTVKASGLEINRKDNSVKVPNKESSKKIEFKARKRLGCKYEWEINEDQFASKRSNRLKVSIKSLFDLADDDVVYLNCYAVRHGKRRQVGGFTIEPISAEQEDAYLLVKSEKKS